MKKSVRRILRIALGSLALVLGVAGLFLPILQGWLSSGFSNIWDCPPKRLGFCRHVPLFKGPGSSDNLEGNEPSSENQSRNWRREKCVKKTGKSAVLEEAEKERRQPIGKNTVAEPEIKKWLGSDSFKVTVLG